MNFTVYSKPNCQQCDKAKTLIKSRGFTYEEKIIDIGQEKEEGKVYVTAQELKTLVPTAKSVPQIFINEELVGGYVELLKRLN